MPTIMTNAAPSPAAVLHMQLFQILSTLISDEERAQMMQVHEALRSISVQTTIKTARPVGVIEFFNDSPREFFTDGSLRGWLFGSAFYMGMPEPLPVKVGKSGPKPRRPRTQYDEAAERRGLLKRFLHRRVVLPVLRLDKTKFDEAEIRRISSDIHCAVHQRTRLVRQRCIELNIHCPDDKALRIMLGLPRRKFRR